MYDAIEPKQGSGPSRTPRTLVARPFAPDHDTMAAANTVCTDSWLLCLAGPTSM